MRKNTAPLPIIELTEYACTEEAFPFSAQEIALFQDRLQERIALLPASRPGYYHLQAGPYVGSFLLPRWVVVIRPKFPLINLFYLLSVVSSIPFCAERSFYQQSDDWVELLVHLFLAETEQIIRGGVHAGYLPREEAIPLIKEKLLFHHIQRYPALLHRPYCRFTEHTADILENRALKWTLFLLQHRRYRSAVISHSARRLSSFFTPVSLVEIPPTTIAEITYTHLTARYRAALHLARLLLLHLTLFSRPGTEPFSAFLVNMNWLFETFITHSLAARLRQKGNITVSLQHRTFLDTAETVPIRIDLLLQGGKKKRVVVDVKYKRLTALGEQTSDLYQVLGYCLATGGKEAVLVYPQGDAVKQEIGLEAGGFHIHVLTLDLEKPVDQLDGEVEHLAKRLFTLLF